MTPCELMAAWRESKGLTKEKAAEAAGIDQAMWSRIENGINRPSIETAIAIFKVTRGRFRVRVEWWSSEGRGATGTDG